MVGKSKSDKSTRGNASQFFVAAELCRRNLVAVVTLGNCPNTDILCSNVSGSRFVHIQVKTFVPGNPTCSVGQKAERDYGENFFWVLAGIPTPDSTKPFNYFIIPSKVMAAEITKAHRQWLNTLGRKGQAHKETTFRAIHLPPGKSVTGWRIEEYKDRWDLIQEKLK